MKLTSAHDESSDPASSAEEEEAAEAPLHVLAPDDANDSSFSRRISSVQSATSFSSGREHAPSNFPRRRDTHPRSWPVVRCA